MKEEEVNIVRIQPPQGIFHITAHRRGGKIMLHSVDGRVKVGAALSGKDHAFPDTLECLPHNLLRTAGSITGSRVHQRDSRINSRLNGANCILLLYLTPDITG